MKNLLFITLIFFSLHLSYAQELELITEWPEAIKAAQNENKDILIILTGSEWCAPCKRMDKKVLAEAEFQHYVTQELIVFLIDLPGGGIIYNSPIYQQYEKFRKKYNANYLPSLILADKTGKKIKTLEGNLSKLKNVMTQLKS